MMGAVRRWVVVSLAKVATKNLATKQFGTVAMFGEQLGVPRPARSYRFDRSICEPVYNMVDI